MIYKNSEVSSLSYYIKSELYEKWVRDKKKVLEQKYQDNIDAYNAVSVGFFKKGEKANWRSSTFVNVTKQKVIAAYAMVIDLLLQGGSTMPFTLAPSPWDTLQSADLPNDIQASLHKSIDDMMLVINQQLLDCNADRELMKCVMSMAIYGETFWRTFIHTVDRAGFKAVDTAGFNDPKYGGQRFEFFRNKTNAPAWRYVSVWNFFRDIETEDMQKNVGCIERQPTSAFNVRQMVGKPYFLTENIKKAILSISGKKGCDASSSSTMSLPPSLRDIESRHAGGEQLEFWGRVPRKILEEFIDDSPKNNAFFGEIEDDGDEVEITAILIEDEIVKLATVERESRPYGRAIWELKLDHIEATGVADNIRNEQKVLNDFVRAFEDNKKLSANVILATKRQYISPLSQAVLDNDGITPGLEIELDDTCDDARKAIQSVIIPDQGSTLLDGIALFERYADESAMLPKILQGEVQAKKKPDTAFELNMMANNAGRYISGCAIKNIDEGIIEPVISYFYKYNMLDPDLGKGKGNFLVKPIGFNTYQNKVVRVGAIQSILNLVLSNEELLKESKIRGLLEELVKSLDIDIAQVLKSEDEKQQEAAQASQSDEARMQKEALETAQEGARVQVEKTKAEVFEIVEKLRLQLEELKMEQASAGIVQQPDLTNANGQIFQA